MFAPLGLLVTKSDKAGVFWGDRDFLTHTLTSALKEEMDRRISENTIHNFAKRLLFSAPFNFNRIKSIADAFGLVTLSQFVELKLGYESKIKNRIKSILSLFFIFKASDVHLGEVYDTVSNSLYIGPARVRSDRYYRYQELSVSEILPDGSNLPMFLNSLTSVQMSDFSDFVASSFGFGIKLDSAGGHMSIHLKYKYDTTNIVDAGFGVSQLLPILAQLWWATSRFRRSRTMFSDESSTLTILAMEQPELHLHPAHQAKLADVFAKSINSDQASERLRLVIETHSSEFVNRLGLLIEEKLLRPEQVDIYIVDEDPHAPPEQSGAKVTLATFDNKGVLHNWPAGFFTPVYE